MLRRLIQRLRARSTATAMPSTTAQRRAFLTEEYWRLCAHHQPREHIRQELQRLTNEELRGAR